MPRCSLTVVILTYNEETHIERAVKNVVDWAEDVFVLDSYSEDRTCELAEHAGAKVFQHEFENYATQRNHALRVLPYQTDWILFLDADELVSPELKDNIVEVLADSSTSVSGYYIPRRFYWMGRWLRRGGMYPVYILRLVRHKYASCHPRRVNEHLQVEGATDYLEGDLHHVDEKPLSEWIAKHNHYSTFEAEEQLLAERRDETDEMARLFGTQAERKRWIRAKIWEPLIPALMRPFLYFAYVYFIRLGFLDGRAGFVYHVLHGFCYRFMIEVKYLMLKRSGHDAVNDSQAPIE